IIEKLSHFKNKYEITEIEPTLNLSEQRNISLNNIETEFFRFIDSGDILPSYTTGFYLEQIKKNNIVFSCVFTHSYNKLKLINIKKLKVNENIIEDNNTNIGRRSTSTNVVFKTSIIKNNEIIFNSNIGRYSEWAFVLDAIHNARKTDYYYKFPLYYRDENHDS